MCTRFAYPAGARASWPHPEKGIPTRPSAAQKTHAAPGGRAPRGRLDWNHAAGGGIGRPL